MSKRTILKLVLIFTFVGFISLMASLHQVKAATITVPDNYSTIQGAVNATNNGDTISIGDGVYNETVTINKQLTLVGENKDNTIIEQITISFTGDVYLTSIEVDQIEIGNSRSVWATGCRFQEAHIHSNARLLLSQSDAWTVHTYDKGEILGFYDLPLFGRVVYALPFGIVFYILAILATVVAAGLMLFYILRRKRQHSGSQGFVEEIFQKPPDHGFKSCCLNVVASLLVMPTFPSAPSHCPSCRNTRS